MIKRERDKYDDIEDLLKLHQDATRKRKRLQEEFNELNADRKRPRHLKKYFDMFTTREQLSKIAKKVRSANAAAQRVKARLIKEVNKL